MGAQATYPSFRVGVDQSPTAAAGYARYIGRAGALAVALGIGAAVATGQGLGLGVATADETGSTDGPSNEAPADPGAASADGPADMDATPPSDGPPAANGAEDAEEQGDAAEDNPRVPEMNYSGGVDTDDEGSVETGEDEDAVELTEEEIPPAPPAPDTGVVEEVVDDEDRSHPTDSESQVHDDVVVQHDSQQTQPSALGGDADRASGRQDVAERDEVIAAPDPDQRGLFTVQELSSDQQLMAAHEPVRTAPEVESPEPAVSSLPGAMLSSATKWVGAVFSAFLAPSPASPTRPPLFWAMLTWVGREVQQTFANRPSIGLVETVTTSAIAATPYEQATALIEQARSFEDQADTQRALVDQIYRGELRKADGFWAQAAVRYADAQTQLRAGQLDLARARIEQARSFEEQAQVQRALAGQIRQGELAKARGFFAQAETRRLAAQQLFQQAGFIREAQAAGLRLQGHRLRWDAALSADQAAHDREFAAAAGNRARTQRQTAQVIRTSTSDVGWQNTATQLSQQAAATDQEAVRLALGAIGLQLRVHVATVVADLHFRLADQLDPNGQ